MPGYGYVALLLLAAIIAVAVVRLRRNNTALEYLNLGIALVALLFIVANTITDSMPVAGALLGVWVVLIAVRQRLIARARNTPRNDNEDRP